MYAGDLTTPLSQDMDQKLDGCDVAVMDIAGLLYEPTGLRVDELRRLARHLSGCWLCRATLLDLLTDGSLHSGRSPADL